VIKLTQETDWLVRYYTAEEANPRRWRLAMKTDDDAMEEAVFSVQGILWQKDLPPFSDRDKYVFLSIHLSFYDTKCSLRKNRLRYLKQSVSITGFDTASFQAAIGSLSSIYAIFTRCVPPTKLQPLTMDEYDGRPSIFASNRLFTPRAEAPTASSAELGSDVDPQGKLIELSQGLFFHSDDNKVHYWERVSSRDGGNRYVLIFFTMKQKLTGDIRFVSIPPTKIQNGDIVEAKLSFLVVPLRGGNFKMVTVLREITIMDGSHAHVSFLFVTPVMPCS
jgi:hypothetical protein